MPSVSQRLDAAFRNAIAKAFGFDADPLISASANPQFGDYQSNAAMSLAKRVAETTGEKINPRAVAEKIRENLDLAGVASETSVAGPGFINIKLDPAFLSKTLNEIADDDRLGVSRAERPQTVIVDYCGANIAKQMHVGHLRSLIIGDVFVRVLDFLGQNVIRQNHVGDWGLQMGMITHAVEASGIPLESLTLEKLEELYRSINKAQEADPTLRATLIAETRKLQQTPKDKLAAWNRARELTIQSIHVVFRRLGVLLNEGDVRGESFYSDDYAPMIESLKQRNLARETAGAIGLFPPGFKNKEGEPRPFVIVSRDGTYQYATFDLAAIRFRSETLKADRVIYTHDSRQAEHFAMLFASAKLVGYSHESQKLEFAPFGTVLGEDGRPLKTRSGENVKLVDLLDEAEAAALKLVTRKNADAPDDRKLPDDALREIAHAVGIGAVKYFDLVRDRISDYKFSFDAMLSMDGNTAPYLQYAHARICSIFRKAGVARENLRVGTLAEPSEFALAKQLLGFADTVNAVAAELKPHFLCNYLYELAGRFSTFYQACPVLESDESTRASRLALCDLTARTLAKGLDLLGIEHPERM